MARDDPDRTTYVSNATGRFEVYCWDVDADVHTLATSRPEGTTQATLSADGRQLWWFDDTQGDEFGRWRVQSFGAGPAEPGTAPPAADQPAPGEHAPGLPEVAPGYPAGLEVGASVVVAGFSDDDGSRIHLSTDAGGSAAVVYRHEQDADVGALSVDERIWVLSHSEHGDSRYPALRAFSVDDGSMLGELWDGPGKGLHAIEFSPIPGDQRLLVGHERNGRDELLLWDVLTGAATELAIDLPGDLSADFYPDGSALSVLHSHAGRSTLYRYDLPACADTTDVGSGNAAGPAGGTDRELRAPGANSTAGADSTSGARGVLTALPAARGFVSAAVARRDGSVWYRWSSAAQPTELRSVTPEGSDQLLVKPAGDPAPGSEPVQDVWVDGPGGRIHALLAVPAGSAPAGGWPAVFAVHGGPADQDTDSFDAGRAVWLDAGLAVVEVNYRGSTGYGSAWRDAITERVGHVELADIAAVHDHLVGAGTVDRSRSVIAGHSWGGFLALLALGTQPDRWSAAVAGVPVADYTAAYEDEMEPLRAYDRALFGGSPSEVPDRYVDSSPLTYVDAVRAPVLVFAGENDPRCPIRQIDNYLHALRSRGARYAVYRFDAGHGSMVIDERLRQIACEIAFVRDALGLPASGS